MLHLLVSEIRSLYRETRKIALQPIMMANNKKYSEQK